MKLARSGRRGEEASFAAAATSLPLTDAAIGRAPSPFIMSRLLTVIRRSFRGYAFLLSLEDRPATVPALIGAQDAAPPRGPPPRSESLREAKPVGSGLVHVDDERIEEAVIALRGRRDRPHVGDDADIEAYAEPLHLDPGPEIERRIAGNHIGFGQRVIG